MQRAIAVPSSLQGQGIGEMLVSDIENILKNNEQSALIVEASGTEEYGRTRDFYAIEDDKAAFWKSLY